MLIPVGPFSYRVELVQGYLTGPGQRRCLGLTFPDRYLIQVSDVPPAAKRLAVLWHEITHAWKEELDISGQAALDDESIANLIGLAMAAMPVKLLVRLHCYMSTGVRCDDVLMVSGSPHPIPVLSMDAPGPASTASR